MAKGQTYNYERIPRVDPITGTRYMQLTSFPTINMHLSYCYPNLTNGFTADSRRVVFLSRRAAHRTAPWDVFRVGVDGADFVQLTEREGVRGAVVSSQKPLVYFHSNGTLYSVDMDTFEEEEISHFETDKSQHGGRFSAWLSADERFCFVSAFDKSGYELIVRHATDGSGTAAIASAAEMRIHSIDPAGRGLFVSLNENGRWIIWLVDFDGARVVRYGENVCSHLSPLGNTGALQGCAVWPEHSLLLLIPGQERENRLLSGPDFWHSSASPDGRWIVADTNRPNEGIFLVNVATRRSAVLLHPHNVGGDAPWSHAHPFFSPDMRYVAFTTDATGSAQVCLVEIPASLTEQLARP